MLLTLTLSSVPGSAYHSPVQFKQNSFREAQQTSTQDQGSFSGQKKPKATVIPRHNGAATVHALVSQAVALAYGGGAISPHSPSQDFRSSHGIPCQGFSRLTLALPLPKMIKNGLAPKKILRTPLSGTHSAVAENFPPCSSRRSIIAPKSQLQLFRHITSVLRLGTWLDFFVVKREQATDHCPLLLRRFSWE